MHFFIKADLLIRLFEDSLHCCFHENLHIVAYLLKARIVKPAETTVGRERLCEHPLLGNESANNNIAAMETVFSVRPVHRLY
jgi:hypothetical protein